MERMIVFVVVMNLNGKIYVWTFWIVELTKRKLKWQIIMNSSEMLFVIWDLKKLWMKWMIRKRLESDWMDERDKELNVGYITRFE